MTEVIIVALLTTRNEESNIKTAIKSILSLTKNLLIIDSHSTDKTVAIINSLRQSWEIDLNLIAREYKSPSDQKNWGIDWIQNKYKSQGTTLFILILDADEELTPALIIEIKEEISLNSADCFYIPRANYFMGQFIKHSNWYPDYNLRLFKGNMARYEDVKVHEHMIPYGEVKYLKMPMIHKTYSSICQYIDRMNRYTDWEVDNLDLKHDQLSKMGRLRTIFYRLPGRPLLRFLYMYVLRMGFLDGRRGFHLAVLSGFYEFTVNLKKYYKNNIIVKNDTK